MSYPRKLHVLVVEDDRDVMEGYKSWFKLLGDSLPHIEPVYAHSFADAKKQINSPKLFHAVLLDLNLPILMREPAPVGFAAGEQLLEELAKRESYPVPVVVVVSGKLNLHDPIDGIQKRLENDFWHGKLVNKGPDQFRPIATALTEALRYNDVGIHIHDSGKEWFPTLSPREQDLLRRCVLSQQSALGVDIRWWSAESGQSMDHPSPNRGPTKVLMGHFLLDDGMGTSIPTFFKFEPAGNGPSVCRDIGILAQKLGHVKIFHTVQSRQRSLIVTQCVSNRGIPVSLNNYLQGNPTDIGPTIHGLVDQVVEQLRQLGEQSEDELPVRQFLWEFLNVEAIEKAWKSCDSHLLIKEGWPSPLAIFDSLRASRSKRWATRSNCTHGDLNATNIAIDPSVAGNPKAYVFDAAGMRADFALRDLATLEVTTILFNSFGEEEQLIQTCNPFYANGFLPDLTAGAAMASNLSQNVATMIFSIRAHFQTQQQKEEYALLVFDAALRQLFGLGIQPSPNKVRNPFHACQLASWTAKWLKNVAPHLFATIPMTDPASSQVLSSS